MRVLEFEFKNYLRWGFLMFMLLGAFVAHAQDANDQLTQSDSLVQENKKPFSKELAGYYERSLEYSPEFSSYDFSQIVSFGLLYEGFTAGFFSSTGAGQVADDPFFPNQYYLPYSHSGGFLGRSLLRNPKIQIYTRLNMSYGKIAWENRNTQQAIFEDRFMIFKPEVQLAYLPFRFIQFFGSLGYRKFHKLDIAQVGSKDYDGITFNIGLRLGYFYKPQEE